MSIDPSKLPATLRPYAARIASAWHEAEDTMGGASGSWWVELIGHEYEPGSHTVHERTLKGCADAIRSATPCPVDCAEARRPPATGAQ